MSDVIQSARWNKQYFSSKNPYEKVFPGQDLSQGFVVMQMAK
jgi:hypothetical protein